MDSNSFNDNYNAPKAAEHTENHGSAPTLWEDELHSVMKSYQQLASLDDTAGAKWVPFTDGSRQPVDDGMKYIPEDPRRPGAIPDLQLYDSSAENNSLLGNAPIEMAAFSSGEIAQDFGDVAKSLTGGGRQIVRKPPAA